MKVLRFGAPIIIALFVMGCAATPSPSPTPTPTPTLCTRETKVCADGSEVGRIPPDCDFALCPGEVSTIPANWLTFADQSFSFRYPADFGSEFITPNNWPPKVERLDQSFACAVPMHGDFCVSETSEGAAGSVYKTYVYSEAFENGTLQFTFTIQEPQCLNYPEPKLSNCQADQANLNLDDIVAKIATSFKPVTTIMK